MKYSKPQSGGHAPLETATCPSLPVAQREQLGDGRRGARSVRPSLMGFTLIELLVTLGIFTVITSVVLAKYNTYNSNAPFANASEDVVLALRQAQVYGVGVRKNVAGCGTGTAYECSYGVYLSTAAADRSSLTIFVDINNNRKWDNESESIEKIIWKSNIQVTGLTCVPSGLCASAGALNVLFRRPDPSAFINSNVDTPATSDVSATVTLTNTITSKTTLITITKAGQISLI